MSGVEGLDALKAKLDGFDQAVNAEMGKRLPELARGQQRILVECTPRSSSERRGSHLRDLLAGDEAVKVSEGKVEVGFVTLPLQKAGFYALWLHFGRKGYEAGSKRRAGKDKRGNQRERKIKRRIGAMAARLFFQVAFLRFRDQIKRERAVARIIAAARSGAGMS